MQEVKKAIILIAGLGTRFLPLSKAIPKELLPLVDKPIIQYLLEEILSSGINEVIFVVSPGKKAAILNYFKKTPKLEKILKERKKEPILAELKETEEFGCNFSFSFTIQKKPAGDGHAIWQTKKIAENEPCAVFFVDDIIISQTPCLTQLLQIYKTCQSPVIALKRLPQEKLSHYGVAVTERITSRLHKIKKIVEKPSPGAAPSDLAVVGRYIITPEVFKYLKELCADQQQEEIILADALEKITENGKTVYGYEIEGEWMECGDKMRWLKSNLFLSLNHQKFGPELKKHFKKIL